MEMDHPKSLQYLGTQPWDFVLVHNHHQEPSYRIHGLGVLFMVEMDHPQRPQYFGT